MVSLPPGEHFWHRQFNAVRQHLCDSGHLQLAAAAMASEDDGHAYSDLLKKLATALQMARLLSTPDGGLEPLQSVRLVLYDEEGRPTKTLLSGQICLGMGLLDEMAKADKFEIAIDLDDEQRRAYMNPDRVDCDHNIRRLCRIIDVLDSRPDLLTLAVSSKEPGMVRPRAHVPFHQTQMPVQGDVLLDMILGYAERNGEETAGWFGDEGNVRCGVVANFMESNRNEHAGENRISAERLDKWLKNGSPIHKSKGGSPDYSRAGRLGAVFKAPPEDSLRLECAAALLDVVPELVTGKREARSSPASLAAGQEEVNGASEGAYAQAVKKHRLPSVTLGQFLDACNATRTTLDGLAQISLFDALQRIAKNVKDAASSKAARKECSAFRALMENLNNSGADVEARKCPIRVSTLVHGLGLLHREMAGDTSDKVWARRVIEQFCDVLGVGHSELFLPSGASPAR